MPTEVYMPSLGESVEEAVITRWLKSKGERVEEYEPLLEVNTDKVDTEVPSPASGVILEIVVPEGATVQAGEMVAVIGAEDEPPVTNGAGKTKVSAPQKEIGAEFVEQTTQPSTAASLPAPGRDRELGFISPVVARIASEHNIDLYQVPGTGHGGRITKQDVLAYQAQLKSGQFAPPAPTLSEKVPPAPETKPTPAFASTADQVIPLTPVRRAIAEHMVRSKHTSPHVTTIMEVDLSRVVAHRQANKANFAHQNANLTFTAYFVAATVGALQAHPIVNSSWSDAGVLVHKGINVGVATSLGDDGLIVPVIKNADRLSLLGLAQAINDLAGRARSRQLQPDEVREGTFTITNHGVSGSLVAMPIISQPQCAILGIGAIQKRVVVIEQAELGDTIAIRPMVYLSLTFDHRILDGASADRFLAKVVELLRDWQ